jgi:hypothetical protein
VTGSAPWAGTQRAGRPLGPGRTGRRAEAERRDEVEVYHAGLVEPDADRWAAVVAERGDEPFPPLPMK